MEGSPAPIPLGSTGRLEAHPLTNAVGNHAVLVREGEQPRALLTAEAGSGERQRVVVVPLDNEVELRVDGDAMAIWLSQGSIGPAPSSVPGWASGIGFVLVIAVVGFAILGSVTFFAWLFGVLGWA
ncbi:MAG: hypothetical protein M3R32_00090 [Chloroflexota bacterium]|nr:hypothetical protein [Chloroflexota bacterium]